VHYRVIESCAMRTAIGIASFGIFSIAVAMLEQAVAAWGPPCCVASPVAGLVALKMADTMRTASPAGRGVFRSGASLRGGNGTGWVRPARPWSSPV